MWRISWCCRLQFFGTGKVGRNSNGASCADPRVANTFGAACCSRAAATCPASFPIYTKYKGTGDWCEDADGGWECPANCHKTHDGESPWCLHDGSNTTCVKDFVVSSGGGECKYIAEAMKYSTAAERCAAEYTGGVVCPPNELARGGDSTRDGLSSDWQKTCSGFQFTWVDEVRACVLNGLPTQPLTVPWLRCTRSMPVCCSIGSLAQRLNGRFFQRGLCKIVQTRLRICFCAAPTAKNLKGI